MKQPTPLADALLAYEEKNVVPFDVPGHKRGKGCEKLNAIFGERLGSLDVNSMKCLDYVNHPVSVIKESENLLAELYGSKEAFFLVNGTTSGVQAMILSVCQPGEKIIMPRNAHKSAMNGLILSGAIPLYIAPDYDEEMGISLNITLEQIREIVEMEGGIKAVFLINPTYFGIASELKAIVDYCHERDIVVLVDEAHGAHLNFSDELPMSAMAAGADMSAISLHKTGGSMTQSSALLFNSNLIHHDAVRQAINLTQTTSASYILMTSLDLARAELAENGKEHFERMLDLSRWARTEINKIDGLYAYGEEKLNGKSFYAFDETKLVINPSGLHMSGFELYECLRDTYKIQMELGEIFTVLAIISLGDTKENLQKLIDALKDISENNPCRFLSGTCEEIPMFGEQILSPRDAFYAKKEVVLLDESIGRIAGESIMIYPPGIPILALGEVITKEVIDYICYIKKKEVSFASSYDETLESIKVVTTKKYVEKLR
ncbi:MAG: aminotransferase class I/II-fold pyridoxal phosphate-dependent enzyme [Clostridia bacterium]|nr:aminotransferase class I/II-fold pyridoxal phosphate-dependent enzyme [Clostridia bacterium]